VRETRECAEPTIFASSVIAKQIHGDSVKPRAGIIPRPIEGSPPPERDHEGLRSQILSKLRTHSRLQKPVDSAEVAIEDERKGSSVNERALDRFSIGHRWSFSRSFTVD
jgi:hypothetical protein